MVLVRGSKWTQFDGGVRVPAFVSGGYLPPHARGTKSTHFTHLADWYPTFCHLANVSATDHRAASYGLPVVDGENLWAVIAAPTPQTHARELYIDRNVVINGTYKLLVGSIDRSFLTKPDYPLDDSTPDISKSQNCNHGCLFDLYADPTESEDLATVKPSVHAALMTRLVQLRHTIFDPNRGPKDPAACKMALSRG